jgi:hypothetical protein
MVGAAGPCDRQQPHLRDLTVNDIESWTGFDLFANLPDDLEDAAENNANWNTLYNF